MQTRAKFRCETVTKKRHWDITKGFLYDVELQPVMGGSEENKAFYEASPGGTITLQTIKDHGFEPGKEYYIDFTEVLPAVPDVV